MVKNQSTSSGLQAIFIISVIAAWLAQGVQTIGFIVMQYGTNTNLSGFVPWILSGILAPIVLFAIFYLTRTNKSFSKQTLFEVLLVTVVATAVQMIANTAVILFPPPLFTDQSVLASQLYSVGMPILASLFILIPILISLRKRGQW